MNIYKIIKKPFFGRFMVKWQNPLDGVEDHGFQAVQVESPSGATLSALFLKTRENPKAVIVLGHPMGKEAKGYFIKNGYTDLYTANGYHVLIFDLNGFGESSNGNFSYYEDILSAGKLAQSLSPGIPVGYHGVSMGGQWATIAFTDPSNPYRFAAVESAATSLDDFWVNYPLPYALLKTLNFFMPRYKRKIRMIDRIREARGLDKILFIYAENDRLTPPAMGERFKNNCPLPSELWIAGKADHAKIMKSDSAEEYQKKLLSFFDDQSRPA